MTFQPIPKENLGKYVYKFVLGKFTIGAFTGAVVDIQKHKGTWWVTASWPMAPHHLGLDGKWHYKVGDGFPTPQAALEAFNTSMANGPIIE